MGIVETKMETTIREFKAAARNPRRRKVGWMPSSRGWQDRIAHRFWLLGSDRSRAFVRNAAPLTPGCAGANPKL